MNHVEILFWLQPQKFDADESSRHDLKEMKFPLKWIVLTIPKISEWILSQKIIFLGFFIKLAYTECCPFISTRLRTGIPGTYWALFPIMTAE